MSYADLRDLRAALSTAQDIAFGLDPAALSASQTEELVDALRRALHSATALRGEHGATGCPHHPRGAVDPLYGDAEDPLPPGYGKCLLCNDRRRRAGTQHRGRR
ncbi:hypothetical protein [Streptomyces zingiberis]|uniref:Uncharacterized protein n=1 Tax=Streptomyces zingiberis TaxID=2053010 RepID=A0ABX1C5V0_9ACTN|nr:hypothetical protein [Streptomyces zingiberis]NJQ03054.1 hypothetical protein [Streptomyces zingiberis]